MGEKRENKLSTFQEISQHEVKGCKRRSKWSYELSKVLKPSFKIIRWIILIFSMIHIIKRSKGVNFPILTNPS